MLITTQQYRDLPFFISKNTFTGDLNTINDLSAIRQAIKNIIMTNSGERAFDYNFGCDSYKNLFENITLELIATIQSKIATNLRVYEQRVQLNDVRVLEMTDNNYISIVVDFSIPDLGINDVVQVNITRTR